MWRNARKERKTMPSSHSPPATHVASDSIAAEPGETLMGAVPQGSPGLLRRVLLKLVGSAERDTRGQGSEPDLDLSARPDAPMFKTDQPRSDKRQLSLALQGGGVFGAFTWGVLDRLLEEDDLELDAVSGASAGAINAVLLASGLAKGGPDEARASLERFWSSVGESAARTLFLHPELVVATADQLSPSQFNPLELNPPASGSLPVVSCMARVSSRIACCPLVIEYKLHVAGTWR